jgi:Spy/CpxP family protein refolding chaperone
MSKLILIVGFLIAFAAGLVVGTESHHATPPSTTTRPSHRGGSWLTSELGLSPEQQEQMKQIWSPAAFTDPRKREERRRQLARERDEAIAALVRPEDKPAYEAVLTRYTEQVAALDREGRAAFQSAVEKTKQLLTPEQRVRYEQFLQRHQPDRGGPRGEWRRDRGERGERGEHGDRSDGRRGDFRPSGVPASRPHAQ